MATKNDLKVGQTLWVVEQDCRQNYLKHKECTISKVGNKNFELKEFPRNKFSIESLEIASDFNNNTKCYFTLQEILDINEKTNLLSKLNSCFDWRNGKNISLEKLRKISDIISEE
jgi:hypothetical protein